MTENSTLTLFTSTSSEFLAVPNACSYILSLVVGLAISNMQIPVFLDRHIDLNVF